jgi:hypothetical protein
MCEIFTIGFRYLGAAQDGEGGMNSICLMPVSKADSWMKEWMAAHYSKPKGFVGRQLPYMIFADGKFFGATVAGSATRFLPGRKDFFGEIDLGELVNNTFFHVERNHSYPFRNFVQSVIKAWRVRVLEDWPRRYGDGVRGFETLVELPRTGECYRRDGWTEIGQTKGFTCKRVAGIGTDSWTGKRVWDTQNLRPKRVFARLP